MQRFDEAVAASERAIAAVKDAYGDDHSSLAWSYSTLGAIRFKQDRFEEAMERHQRALAIWRASLGEKHALVGHALGNIASVHLAKGELKEALAHYERAYETNSAALGPDHIIVCDALTGKADVFVAQGTAASVASAIELYRRSLAIQEKSPPDVELHARTSLGLERALAARRLQRNR